MSDQSNLKSWKEAVNRNNEEIKKWRDKITDARDGLVLTHHELGISDGTKEDYIKFCNKIISHYEEMNEVFISGIRLLESGRNSHDLLSDE